jgi:endonuclease/exonuclease/phosphatase family metal-dependent hydrolase
MPAPNQVLMLILSFFLIQANPIQCQETTRLRILTYNIYHGATMKGDFNLDTIARRIAFHQPDLVALQEVDRLTNRARKLDLVAELGYRTRMTPLYARAMYYDSGEYGNGVLSRYSFIKTENRPLPSLPENEPRTSLEVMIQLPGGDTVVFVATHLEASGNNSSRIMQAQELADRYRDYPYPVILAGDLNDTPDSEALKRLLTVFTSVSENLPAPTYPSKDPKKQIDYILFDKMHPWNVISAEVIRDEMVSDHCGFLGVLELIKN